MDDSWEEASIDEFVEHTKKKESIKIIKMRMLHQILKVIDYFKIQREVEISEEWNDHEKVKEIRNRKNLKKSTFAGFYEGNVCQILEKTPFISKDIEDNIAIFLGLVCSNVESKIHIAFGKEITSFVEHMGIDSKIACDGNILTIDRYGAISDSIVIFSKKYTY